MVTGIFIPCVRSTRTHTVGRPLSEAAGVQPQKRGRRMHVPKVVQELRHEWVVPREGRRIGWWRRHNHVRQRCHK